MKAKKHFGQHFLTNADTAKQIVESLDELEENKVLEVGPGMGVLTEFLIEGAKRLKVVEIDEDAANYVQNKWPNLEIIRGDFLKISLESCFDSNYSIIGNFPYNISSQIVFKIIENSEYINQWVGMFQLEMGNRLIAVPHNKQYGILSVLLPFYYRAEKVMTLPPGAFNPPPKVNSIVLKATRVKHQFKCDPKLLKRVVKTAFNQRRKVLSNSLSSILPKEVLNTSQFANLRPENLSPQQFEELSEFIERNVGN
ncbi:MAG: ribosomal RNA small subunit methyltransferase A [Bacteroidia bacterium]